MKCSVHPTSYFHLKTFAELSTDTESLVYIQFSYPFYFIHIWNRYLEQFQLLGNYNETEWKNCWIRLIYTLVFILFLGFWFGSSFYMLQNFLHSTKRGNVFYASSIIVWLGPKRCSTSDFLLDGVVSYVWPKYL